LLGRSKEFNAAAIDANRHGVVLVDAGFSSAVRTILREFAPALEGQTGWTGCLG
jgi:hypothetical protein